jgi:CxxC motif-containing protein (DUF1111 family)
MRRWIASLVLVAACGDDLPGDELQGGELASVVDRSALAFTHPLATLSADQLETHNLGRGPFQFHWTPPQLGPLFNHDSCVACHARNGRGLSQIGPDVAGSQALVRVSSPDEAGAPDVPGGAVPVPGFGTQLQDHATFGLPEVQITLTWIEVPDQLDDGEPVMLRRPLIAIASPNGDPLPAMRLSYRTAPPLVGLGLLEAIPEAAIVALEDPADADGDGISGRANRAWDEASRSTQLGRFGWKASVPRLVEQIAGAFVNDMGLTNLIFPPADGARDVNDNQLVQVAFHVATLAVPAAAPRDARSRRGRALFDDFQCSGCHVPDHVTGDATEIFQLRGQLIRPYTDLLLHDLGDGLTDARADFLATGEEWRTPPLWGLGLAQDVAEGATFLHDGRARTLTEAILWHGGEAAASSAAFRRAPRADREALLAFLATL